jgi:hypothetical protein
MTDDRGTAASENHGQESGGGLPQCVYFYHLTVNPNDPDHPLVRAYHHDEKAAITPAAVDAVAQSLLTRARAGDIQPAGYGVGDLRWRRSSYLVFVADTQLGSLEDVGLPENGNHTFGRRFKINGLSGATGVAYWNKMIRGPNATECEGDRWCEAFRLHPNPARAKGFFTHEDTGTNMGPPVPPP